MINIGSELQAALVDYDLTAVSFLTIGFTNNGGIMRVTEAPRDLVFDGQMFESSSNLRGLSAPDTQNAIDRDNYSVAFSDNDGFMRRRFLDADADGVRRGPHGIGLTVQLGIMANGVLVSEPLNVYKGQSAAMSWNPSSDGYVLEVGFTGQLTQLDSSNSMLTTKENQRQRDNDDTSMDQVHSGVNDDAIKWGRKS